MPYSNLFFHFYSPYMGSKFFAGLRYNYNNIMHKYDTLPNTHVHYIPHSWCYLEHQRNFLPQLPA